MFTTFSSLKSNSTNQKSVWNWEAIIEDCKKSDSILKSIFNTQNYEFLKNAKVDAKKGKDTQFKSVRNDLRKISNQLVNAIQSTESKAEQKQAILKDALLFFQKFSFITFDSFFYESTKKNVTDFVKVETTKK